MTFGEAFRSAVEGTPPANKTQLVGRAIGNQLGRVSIGFAYGVGFALAWRWIR